MTLKKKTPQKRQKIPIKQVNKLCWSFFTSIVQAIKSDIDSDYESFKKTATKSTIPRKNTKQKWKHETIREETYYEHYIDSLI